MVCAKCQSKLKKTSLATPDVKKKNDIYLGSGTSAAGASKGKATLGNTGISKSKALSKSAKNPYAAYSASCEECKTKVDAGKKFCHRCAYKSNKCAMCGKGLTAGEGSAPLVQGQKFSAK